VLCVYSVVILCMFLIRAAIWHNNSSKAATLRGSRPGVQSASLYDNFGKSGNYVIMTSLMTS